MMNKKIIRSQANWFTNQFTSQGNCGSCWAISFPAMTGLVMNAVGMMNQDTVVWMLVCYDECRMHKFLTRLVFLFYKYNCAWLEANLVADLLSRSDSKRCSKENIAKKWPEFVHVFVFLKQKTLFVSSQSCFFRFHQRLGDAPWDLPFGSFGRWPIGPERVDLLHPEPSPLWGSGGLLGGHRGVGFSVREGDRSWFS